RSFLHRHRAHLADILAGNAHELRLGTQARAAALRTNGISAIAAQEDPHMQLVLLALQVRKESADTRISPVAFRDHLALLARQFRPGLIERNIVLLGEALQFAEQRTIFRLGEWLNRALREALRLIWHNQIRIEINGVAEPLASRACAIRIVERKHPRFGFLVAEPALLAFEAIGKSQPLW